MKKQIAKVLEKASIDMLEKKASHVFFGEREIPKVILDEITKRKSQK